MPATYEPISTQTLANNTTATVTFSSIPSTYTDLILVFGGTRTTGASDIFLRFNSDTATNYSRTYLSGNGSSAASARGSNETAFNGGGYVQTVIGSSIFQIFNYANTTTFKTVLARTNYTDVAVSAYVGLWRATPAAITTIDVGTGNFFASGSTFTLYGIKAA